MLLREPMIGSNFSIEVGVSYEISNFVIDGVTLLA